MILIFVIATFCHFFFLLSATSHTTTFIKHIFQPFKGVLQHWGNSNNKYKSILVKNIFESFVIRAISPFSLKMFCLLFLRRILPFIWRFWCVFFCCFLSWDFWNLKYEKETMIKYLLLQNSHDLYDMTCFRVTWPYLHIYVLNYGKYPNITTTLSFLKAEAIVYQVQNKNLYNILLV